MQGRMGEVSKSTKQDRLPQLFLINKFPGPFEFFRRGEERYSIHVEGGTPRTVTTWPGSSERGLNLGQEAELGGRLVLEWWLLSTVIEHLLFACPIKEVNCLVKAHVASEWGAGIQAGFVGSRVGCPGLPCDVGSVGPFSGTAT